MRLAEEYLSAFLATIKRDAGIFLSYRLRLFTQILTVFFSLTLYSFISKLVRPDAVGPHGRYFAFAVLGIVIVDVLAAALTTSQQVRAELLQGNFERILTSPFGPVGGVLAVAAFPIFYALFVAMVTLTLAVAVFSVPINLDGIAPALAVGLLGAVAFAAIGLLFVALLITVKSAMGTNWVIAGLSLVGGAYFPVRLLPGWLRWLSEAQPFTPAVDLLRHLLVSTPSLEPTWLELVRLIAFTGVLLPVSAAVLRLSIGFSRRRGTIMEF